jgi:hypothetical protein
MQETFALCLGQPLRRGPGEGTPNHASCQGVSREYCEVFAISSDFGVPFYR